ncbi:MAG: GNAT family N-acetyltransferase [Streptosporangiaceae bacterium]
MAIIPAQAEPAAWRVTAGPPAPAAVERLLRSLPQWFGIESSTAEYIRMAAQLPAYLAWPAGPPPAGQQAFRPGDQPEPAGVLLAVRHFPRAAEIYLMAVDPAEHRRGAGRALVTALERDLVVDGVRLLQVKTQGPSLPDAGYERTRKFYRAMEFEPLEEIAGLWPGNPCLIMVKTLG